MQMYLAVVRIEIAEARAYLLDWLAGLLYYPVRLLTLTVLWNAVFAVSGAKTLGGYSSKEMICYYFAVVILYSVVYATAGIENVMWEGIIRGDMTPFLVRPFSYPLFLFFRTLSKALRNLVCAMPVLLIFRYIAGLRVTFMSVFSFCAMSLLGTTIYFLIFFMVGLLSFRMERIFGIRDMLWVLVDFLAGSVVPLDILPPTLRRISELSPFRFIFFEPVRIILGKSTSGEETALWIAVGFVATVGVIARSVWNRLVTEYDGPGG